MSWHSWRQTSTPRKLTSNEVNHELAGRGTHSVWLMLSMSNQMTYLGRRQPLTRLDTQLHHRLQPSVYHHHRQQASLLNLQCHVQPVWLKSLNVQSHPPVRCLHLNRTPMISLKISHCSMVIFIAFFLYVKTSSEVMHLECIISVYDATTSGAGKLASPGWLKMAL